MTFEEEFEQYKKFTIPDDASPAQIQDTKAAFCAGAFVVMQAINEIGGLENEDIAITKMAMLDKQVTEAVKCFVDPDKWS